MMRAVRDQVAMVAAGTGATGGRTLRLTACRWVVFEAAFFDFGLAGRAAAAGVAAESTRRIAWRQQPDRHAVRPAHRRAPVGAKRTRSAPSGRVPARADPVVHRDGPGRRVVSLPVGARTAPFQHWGPPQALTTGPRALPRRPRCRGPGPTPASVAAAARIARAQPLIDRRLDTPDAHEVSARCALAVARGGGRPGSAPKGGRATVATHRPQPVYWRTPDEFLPVAVAAVAQAASVSHRARAVPRHCRWHRCRAVLYGACIAQRRATAQGA